MLNAIDMLLGTSCGLTSLAFGQTFACLWNYDYDLAYDHKNITALFVVKNNVRHSVFGSIEILILTDFSTKAW